MKKIVLLMGCIFALMFSGCTGIITGTEYSKADLVVMYKVTKTGINTFMTEEQIAQAKLDKLDIVVQDSFKVVTKEEADAANASTLR